MKYNSFPLECRLTSTPFTSCKNCTKSAEGNSKRQDWDHKAYHGAPSAIECACHPHHWETAQYIALGAS